jgi:inorganic pyrophosphatase
VQDVKKGQLRYVKHFFPYTGYICNYGAIPQTWEDAGHRHPETGALGDNDPIDVCEIGGEIGYTGQVKSVKVLGCLAMLDDGETDWKIIAIDVRDQLADKLNDIDDVETHLPGYLKALREWFRDYKLADGKPENQFAFDGHYKDRAYAENIVEECHRDWKALVRDTSKAPDIST